MILKITNSKYYMCHFVSLFETALEGVLFASVFSKNSPAQPLIKSEMMYSLLLTQPTSHTKIIAPKEIAELEANNPARLD